MATEIRVPTLGESVSEATIAQWFKKPGDAVSQDEPLVELETDKVTVEVPAPAAGTLESIVVKEGDTVEVGALLGQIAEGAGAPAAKAEAAPAKADAKAETKSEKAQLVDVVTPSAGESVTEAEVGEWSVKVGDVVKADDTLVELETDKAAQEVPAPVAGTIVKIAVETGTTVEPGVLLCQIDPSGEGAAAAPAAAAPAPAASAPAASGGSSMPPAPSAQKMMAENNLSADQVAGSGKRGQVLKEDVINAIASGATSSSSAPSAAPLPVARLPPRTKFAKNAFA